MLKTVDMRLSWPFRIGERVRLEPNVAAFNVLNFANFGGAGRQLNGVLDGSPGSSLNGASSAARAAIRMLSVPRGWTGPARFRHLRTGSASAD